MDLDVHLAGIAARDEMVFAGWMAGAEPAIRRRLGSFAASVDVEAVVQETLLRIWQGAPTHEPDGRPDSLLRLAFRIAHRLAIDETRRRGRVPMAGLDAETPEPPDPSPEADPLLRRVVIDCLEKLSGRPARALSARLEASGERDEALAFAIGMAVNTFRQNVARARRAMRTCLTRHGVDLEEVLR